MAHLHIVMGQQLLLMLIDPDAMRQAESRGSEASVGKIGHVRQTCAASDQRDFIAVLGRVRVHEKTVFARQRPDGFKQLLRT